MLVQILLKNLMPFLQFGHIVQARSLSQTLELNVADSCMGELPLADFYPAFIICPANLRAPNLSFVASPTSAFEAAKCNDEQNYFVPTRHKLKMQILAVQAMV